MIRECLSFCRSLWQQRCWGCGFDGKTPGGTLPLLVVALSTAGQQGTPGCGDSGARDGATDGAVMCSI